MSTDGAIADRIDAAAESVGSVWPLHSFVTANPLAGLEDRPFQEAVSEASDLLGAEGYPSAEVFQQAWEQGRIDTEILATELADRGSDLSPEESLERMIEDAETGRDTDAGGPTTPLDRVDAVLTKWLSAFLDQGTATWPMPNRDRGFYEAVRSVARYDGAIPNASGVADGPGEPIDAIRACLEPYPVGEWADVFEFQLAALPGWTGFLKRRAESDDAWQSAAPITLRGYLAVRLLLVDAFDAPMTPGEAPEGERATAGSDGEELPLPQVWLRAWEATYRSELVGAISTESAAMGVQDTSASDRPDAQLVFCIDTRSEILRRHLEAAGDYETHGYAGFFGVPMRYAGYDGAATVDACPPILDPEHRIAERPAAARGDRHERYDRWRGVLDAGSRAIDRLRSNAATAFSFVESTGLGYGGALAARTLAPARVGTLLEKLERRIPDVPAFCDPAIDRDPAADGDLPAGLTLEEKVEYAATAFEAMGWTEFARLVVFTGHASRTTNNPFDSSLDCGACAANPGGPSARVLAAICNEESVRSALRERGIEIPADTVFLAGEHNTTTDAVELYARHVPDSHAAELEALREDLETARAGATAERAGDMVATDAGTDRDAARRETRRRAADWAETRPEWGLAGNAGFVIGPRALTEDLDLDGRAFLHSYDWQSDDGGDALETILTGPMVVTQWINAQYYFATVDTATYGSGSKVTQNPVGNVGVYQGNGGDLMSGLPQQSLYSAHDDPYHQPIRLSVVVHAPVDRVTGVLADHEELTTLLDNRWLSLSVVDPTRDHRAFEYAGDLEWEPTTEEDAPSPAPQPEPATAED